MKNGYILIPIFYLKYHFNVFPAKRKKESEKSAAATTAINFILFFFLRLSRQVDKYFFVC